MQASRRSTTLRRAMLRVFTHKKEADLRFTLSEKKLRSRIVEEISALRYPPEDAHHLVDEMVKDFRYSLQDKEDAILQELLATKKIGLGLGWGPGGGPYSYIFLDQ